MTTNISSFEFIQNKISKINSSKISKTDLIVTLIENLKNPNNISQHIALINTLNDIKKNNNITNKYATIEQLNTANHKIEYLFNYFYRKNSTDIMSNFPV